MFANETPEGYTWHHSEVPGKLELVDEEIHAETGHTGGRELWGDGLENR
ncbi:HNH endonuclease [Actinomycetes bacterium NPDC127524]